MVENKETNWFTAVTVSLSLCLSVCLACDVCVCVPSCAVVTVTLKTINI